MTVTLERPAPPRPPAPPPRPDHGPGRRPGPEGSLQLLAWLVVVAVGMFFVGLTAALLARMGSAGWAPPPRPPVLWPGTAALLASSALLEGARRALRRGDLGLTRARLRQGAGLGTLFLAGQVAAWGWLASSGVGLAASPAASYFYVLSGAHLAHVAGGLVGWWVLSRRVRGGAGGSLSAFAVYWHFLGLLWLWLFIVLFTG